MFDINISLHSSMLVSILALFSPNLCPIILNTVYYAGIIGSGLCKTTLLTYAVNLASMQSGTKELQWLEYFKVVFNVLSLS